MIFEILISSLLVNIAAITGMAYTLYLKGKLLPKSALIEFLGVVGYLDSDSKGYYIELGGKKEYIKIIKK